MQVEVKNRFELGDRVEVLHPSGNQDVTITHIENSNGEPMPAAPGSGHRVWVNLPEQVQGAFVARYL